MLALLAGASMLTIALRRGEAVPLRKQLAEFPMKVDDWEGRVVPFDNRVLRLLAATDVLSRVYTRGRDEVSLYTAYYAMQRAGESMHSPKNCLPGGGWDVLDQRRVLLAIPAAGKTIQVNQIVVQSGTESQFVLYWYETRGHAFASEYEGKAILVWEALRTGRTDGAIIRVMGPVVSDSSKGRAEALVTGFTRRIYPLLKEYLPN